MQEGRPCKERAKRRGGSMHLCEATPEVCVGLKEASATKGDAFSAEGQGKEEPPTRRLLFEGAILPPPIPILPRRIIRHGAIIPFNGRRLWAIGLQIRWLLLRLCRPNKIHIEGDAAVCH